MGVLTRTTQILFAGAAVLAAMATFSPAWFEGAHDWQTGVWGLFSGRVCSIGGCSDAVVCSAPNSRTRASCGWWAIARTAVLVADGFAIAGVIALTLHAHYSKRTRMFAHASAATTTAFTVLMVIALSMFGGLASSGIVFQNVFSSNLVISFGKGFHMAVASTALAAVAASCIPGFYKRPVVTYEPIADA